jgi:hypothetical protein
MSIKSLLHDVTVSSGKSLDIWTINNCSITFHMMLSFHHHASHHTYAIVIFVLVIDHSVMYKVSHLML